MGRDIMVYSRMIGGLGRVDDASMKRTSRIMANLNEVFPDMVMSKNDDR